VKVVVNQNLLWFYFQIQQEELTDIIKSYVKNVKRLYKLDKIPHISKHHHDNECDFCHKKGKFCAMMDNLEEHFFKNMCIDCYKKNGGKIK